MTIDLRALSFGAPAAEREINKGLVDYFVESEAYRRVLAGEKTILLGNRGVGKSAIFKVLAAREKAKGSIILELNPEDYSYEILSQSLRYRPREIIQFCTTSLEEARGSGTIPIDYSTISKAELAYSEERTKDIAAEYRFQYPGLRSIFEVFRGRTYTIDRVDLELLCIGITIGEFGLDPSTVWVQNQDHDFLIEVLWKVGFLRAYAVGGLKARRRSGSSYLGPHQVSTLNLRSIARFQVHPMFRAFLGMKEPKGE